MTGLGPAIWKGDHTKKAIIATARFPDLASGLRITRTLTRGMGSEQVSARQARRWTVERNNAPFTRLPLLDRVALRITLMSTYRHRSRATHEDSKYPLDGGPSY
jgi:hypothetical protein